MNLSRVFSVSNLFEDSNCTRLHTGKHLSGADSGADSVASAQSKSSSVEMLFDETKSNKKSVAIKLLF